ncbi:hypothetical protein Tco_1145052 [Tanacetum coccineum]
MNPQETQQVAARDEKWVPSAESVKISSTNIRLETTVPQKEETFQVVIDIIKNSTCFKDFTISADFPEIFMQVEGVDFIDVPDDDTALTFLIDLGYKGPLNRHTNMFMDHMHQPWRTLAAIIKKCLSRKIASNDKLKKSRIDILSGMLKFVRIGEDYQEYGLPILDVMLTDAIKHLESYQMFIKYSTNQIPPKKSRGKGSKGKKTTEESRETIDVSEESEPEPEPAKKQTSSKRRVKKKATLSADDNIISNDLADALELAKSISQTKAKEAEAARKVHATHARIVTESVPESAKKKSSGRSSKSVVIQDTPSTPNSKPATSKTKLKGAPSLTPQEQEAADIMQALKESKKTRRRQPGTKGSNEGTGSKPGVPDESTNRLCYLNGGDEQDSEFSDDDNDDVEKDDKDGDVDDEDDDHVSDTQDADDEDDETESDKDEIYKYKIHVRKDEDVEMKDAEVEESDKGEEKVTDAAKEEAEKTSEEKDDAKKTELPPSSSSLSVSLGFGVQFLKIYSDSSLVSIVKDSADTYVSSLLDIPIQQETPQAQSSSFNCCPLTSSDTYYLNRATNTNTNPNTPITTEVPTIITAVHESNALFTVELRVAKLEKDVSELKTVDHSSEALAVLQSQVPTVVDSYLDTKVGDVFQKELQKHMAYLIHKYSLQHLPELTKKPTPTAEQESEKSPLDILKIKKEQDEKQKKPQFTIKSTDKAALKEYDLKSALYQSMYANKSFNRNLVNHRLYHALMEALIKDENAMDKGVADIVKDHKRKHDDDDEDPPAGPNQGKKTKRIRTKESESSKKPSSTKETPKGKAPTKGSKTGKSDSAKEPVEEPITEVIMDDVARDDNQPQDTSKPKRRKNLNPDWFKQPPRPPNPDPE